MKYNLGKSLTSNMAVFQLEYDLVISEKFILALLVKT